MLNLPDFDQLWDYSNPKATEQAFRALLPGAEASDDKSYHIQLLTQIGRTLGLQRKFEDAHAILDQAEQLITEDLKTPKIRLLLERGRSFNSGGEKSKAEKLFLEAWDYGQSHNLDYYAVDAAHMMGYLLAGSGKAKDKLAWEEKALGLAEKSDSEKAKKWLGSLYNNIGWSYHEMGQVETAKSMFEKCLDWQLANNREKGAKIARWSIAKMLRLLGRTEEALDAQRALLEANGNADPDGYTFEEIAECYNNLREKEKTSLYAQKAWDILSKDKWLTEHEPERLERLKKMSDH